MLLGKWGKLENFRVLLYHCKNSVKRIDEDRALIQKFLEAAWQ